MHVLCGMTSWIMHQQELEDLLDDDQDMEDMYLGRRRGEEAVVALQQMAYIAERYSDGTQTDDEEGAGNLDGVSTAAIPVAHMRSPAEVCFQMHYAIAYVETSCQSECFC